MVDEPSPNARLEPYTPLEMILAKLERADQHIEQLDAEINAFLNLTDNGSVFYDNPKLGNIVERFFQDSIINLNISILTGEAIHQIRSSLDHMMSALVIKDGGTVTGSTQFPIFKDKPVSPKYVSRYQGQIAGIKRPEVLAAIESLQPYHRGSRAGNHWLYILKTLNNSEKHASLMLHIMDVRRSIFVETVSRDKRYESTYVGPDDGTEPTGYTSADGDFIDVVKVKRHIAVDIALSKWGDTGQTVSVRDGLFTFRSQVGEIITTLSAFL